jgi:hypothetical protein
MRYFAPQILTQLTLRHGAKSPSNRRRRVRVYVSFIPPWGTIAFTPGITSRVFTVNILDEGLHEMSETISLMLSAPVNASLGLDTATLTILDNDHYLLYLPAAIKP